MEYYHTNQDTYAQNGVKTACNYFLLRIKMQHKSIHHTNTAYKYNWRSFDTASELNERGN